MAQQRGISADELVREAADKILESVPDQIAKPKKSAFGLLARYGPGPTEEEIDENRREMFLGFAEDLVVCWRRQDAYLRRKSTSGSLRQAQGRLFTPGQKARLRSG